MLGASYENCWEQIAGHEGTAKAHFHAKLPLGCRTLALVKSAPALTAVKRCLSGRKVYVVTVDSRSRSPGEKRPHQSCQTFDLLLAL